MAFKITEDRIILFDGAMGTMMQSKGLKAGFIPEMLNLTHPEIIESIHREYIEAGSDVVSANTFGANRYKAQRAGHSVKELVSSALAIARKAVSGHNDKYVALDIGPCGRVMQPAGDLPFDEAVDVFSEIFNAGCDAGADLIILETFTDLYELKAAIVAAKENSTLPLLATMSFEENGSTFFGATVESMVLTLEALGVDALGVNCSLGPKQLFPVVKRILEASSIPVIVQPNAGLPVVCNGNARYDITSAEFAGCIRNFADMGVAIVGGCCGTNPEYIKQTREQIKDCKRVKRDMKKRTGICSPSRPVFFGEDTVIIGERLNPTGKNALKAALRASDMDFLMHEAICQQEQGAHVLDVNVGLPDIDEPAMLVKAVTEIQGITDIPLQIDSSDYDALERAVRVYNGKPLINSVNGKKDSLERVLPIAKKYGAAVLGLTLDENGVPENAEARLEIAGKIIKAAAEIGIPREDVLIDCLVVTASAQQHQVAETLKAVRLVKEKLGVSTVLGVSNVSFGLPARPVINRSMLAMALMQGLDAPIMNPADAGMSETVAACRVLLGKDVNSSQFIEKFSGLPQTQPAANGEEIPCLAHAVAHGLKKEARTATEKLLGQMEPLEIIEKEIIPALDMIGADYEAKKIFLPQLLKSAEAAKASFERLRGELLCDGAVKHDERKKIVIATVHGDIHDIGKNIVKVIMENYNFHVIDLGRDVPPGDVVTAVKESAARLVGLSALMTTTVASMKTTVGLLKRECPGVRILVGGAVLTPDLAEYVGADYYAKDAIGAVRTAEAALNEADLTGRQNIEN